VFDCLDEETDPGVEHRIASLCRHLCAACRTPPEELPWPQEERRYKGKDGPFTKAEFEEKYTSGDWDAAEPERNQALKKLVAALKKRLSKGFKSREATEIVKEAINPPS